MYEKTPQGLAIILVITLLTVFINKCPFNTKKPNNNVKDLITSKVNEINKELPVKIEDYGIMSKAIFIPPKELQFEYILNIDSKSVDTISVKPEQEKEIILDIKNDTTLKLLRENDVTFSYRYFDSLNHLIHTIRIEHNKYK